MPIKLSDKSGAILLTVIILSMVLSIIVITIMSANVGQVKTSQEVIDQIKARHLAKSYFYQYHQESIDTGAASLPDGTIPEPLDDKTFTTVGLVVTPPNDPEQLTVTVNY